RLGDLARSSPEQRIWRDAAADRYTRLDRQLLEAAAGGGEGLAAAAGRPGSYGALLRARLAHLQRLGLATRTSQEVRLAPRLELQLRALRLRADEIRAVNQRRLEGARSVRTIDERPARGVVIRSGRHDELGAEAYVLVRQASGEEVYARLRLGAVAPRVGASVTLLPAGPGQARIAGLERHLARTSLNIQQI